MRAILIAVFLLAAPARAEMVVPVRTIPAGTIIGAGDLKMVPGQASHGLSDISSAVGLQARVALYQDRAFRATDVGPPTVVERNVQTVAAYQIGGLTITTPVRALGAAGVGDSVRVMNLTSRKILWGVVDESGRIIVAQ